MKRYLVFSAVSYEPATSIPAGRYDELQDAIAHADSVTYRMAVIDSLAESRGFIYCNWDKPKITSITREDDCGHCTLFATFDNGMDKRLFSYYIDELSFTDADLLGLTEDEAHALRHARDVAYLRS